MLLLSVATAFAGFSERKLESAMKAAAKSGKNIAFVFYQDYYDPNCPKCVADVSEKNEAVKKAIPRSEVVMVEIEKGDKDMDKLPSAVSATGTTPRVVVTDATGEKVIAKLDGAPDKKKAAEFKESLESPDSE